MEKRIENKIDKIENNIGRIEKNIDRVLNKLEEHDEKFDLVFGKLEEHDRVFDNMFMMLDDLSLKVDKVVKWKAFSDKTLKRHDSEITDIQIALGTI